MAKAPIIRSAVMCDIHRKEKSNKDILIGVYGGGVIFGELPTKWGCTIWMEVLPSTIGKSELLIKISYPSDNKKNEAEAVVKLSIDANNLDPFSIIVPTPILEIPNEGKFKVSTKPEGGRGRWRVILEKPIYQSQSIQTNASPPPS